MLKVISACLVLATLAAPVLAGDEPDCENGSQAELNMCAYMDFDKADKALNKLWPKVKKFVMDGDADFDADQKGYLKALMASQRGWLAYRDGQCELYGFQSHGGSMEPMLVSGCKAGLTKKRIVELQDVIDVEN
jgi:uncharacterized protein YecT (DUF1311 family)